MFHREYIRALSSLCVYINKSRALIILIPFPITKPFEISHSRATFMRSQTESLAQNGWNISFRYENTVRNTPRNVMFYFVCVIFNNIRPGGDARKRLCILNERDTSRCVPWQSSTLSLAHVNAINTMQHEIAARCALVESYQIARCKWAYSRDLTASRLKTRKWSLRGAGPFEKR